jgi:phosphoenolpyruvate carboxykinase (ATP)
MHSGSNIDENENVSVFFGLSGTGKTTLSTDKGKTLIGDDEHGLSSDGIFNIEGGCYAKTFNLTEKGEPQVFHAANRFGSILENVCLDVEHNPVFTDKSITENGRASYPLKYVEDASTSGIGPFPKQIFFLSADAMGVLPAVAKLDIKQAEYFFLSGYTAKLAGTEVGLAGIKAAFSHCFGAPFMMRHPTDYSNLLKKFLDSHPLNVWLINTGWYGGAYGVGQRYDLSITRSIIRALQKGIPEKTRFSKEKVFNLSIPESIPGVDAKFLNARALWSDPSQYDETASRLKKLFEENFQKFSIDSTELPYSIAVNPT